MYKPLVAIAIVIIILLFAQPILGSLPWFQIIGTKGKIEIETLNVGVYWDTNCTNPVNSLDWGRLDPGSTSNISFIIRNEGNRYSTLFLNATNWNPTNASNYLTLKWNYDGRTLSPNAITAVTLSLIIASTTHGIENFTFDVIIGANGIN